jgi:hypothetical protein
VRGLRLLGSWETENGCEEGTEVEVGSSVGFILAVGLASALALTRPRGRASLEQPGARGTDFPIQTPGFLMRNHPHVHYYN